MSKSIERAVVFPLGSDQVEAAAKIHDDLYMPGWASTDRALTLLAKSVPGWDADSVLLKAAAVNQLYNARHFRFGETVEQIVQARCDGRLDPGDDPVAIVEAIAPLPVGGKTYWYLAFASKFAHWFINPERIPIYDSWGVKGLRHHFGRLKWGASDYGAFMGYVGELQRLRGLSCSLRELDWYLWLSGQLRAWQASERREKVSLSGKVRALFESHEPAVKSLLRQLLGE